MRRAALIAVAVLVVAIAGYLAAALWVPRGDDDSPPVTVLTTTVTLGSEPSRDP